MYKKFSDAQTKTLNDHFLQTSKHPDHAGRTRLADDTGLHFDQVTTWFQNKRQRTKEAPAASFPLTAHGWHPLDQVLCEGGQLRTTAPVPTYSLLLPQFAHPLPSSAVIGRPQFAHPLPSPPVIGRRQFARPVPSVNGGIVAWTLEEIAAALHAPLAEEDAAAILAPGPRATASKQQGGCGLEPLSSSSTCSSSRDEDLSVELLDAAMEVLLAEEVAEQAKGQACSRKSKKKKKAGRAVASGQEPSEALPSP